LVTVGWLLAISIALAVIFGLVPYLDEEQVPDINDFAQVAYGTLNRLAWATAVAWVIFACSRGYGGLFKSTFSLILCMIIFNVFANRNCERLFILEDFHTSK